MKRNNDKTNTNMHLHDRHLVFELGQRVFAEHTGVQLLDGNL